MAFLPGLLLAVVVSSGAPPVCLPHDALMQQTLDRGRHAFRLGNYDEALAIFERGLSEAHARADREYAANFLTGIGAAHEARNEPQAARKSGLEALAIYRRLDCTADEAKQLVNLGSSDERLGNLGAAEAEYGAGLTLYRQLGNIDGEAKAYNDLGVVENDRGNYEAALVDAKRALTMAQTAHDLRTQAESLDDLGNAQERVGRFTEAESSYRAALSLYRRLPDQPNAGTAKALIGIARVDELSGEYQDALENQNAALRVAKRIGDRDQLAIVLENLGNTATDLGEYDGALADHETALKLFRAVGDTAGLERERTNVGNVRTRQGDEYSALASYESALRLDRRLKDRGGEADDLANAGEAEAELQWYDEALRSERAALQLHRALGNRYGEAGDLGNIANLEQARHDYGGAIEKARQAAQIEAALGTPQWKALRTQAAAEASLNRVEPALHDYEAAIDDIERLRASLESANGGGNRTSFFGTTLLVYDQYIDFLLDLNARFPGKGYDRKALEIFERRQGRAFLEQIARVAAKRFSGVPVEISRRDAELAGEIDALRERLARALSQRNADPGGVASLRQTLAEHVAERRSFEAQIARDYRAYYALQHPQPLRERCASAGCTDLAHFQRDVMRRGEAVLVYDLLPGRPVLWIVTPRRIDLVALSAESPAPAMLAAFSPESCAAAGYAGLAVAIERYPSETARSRTAAADLLPCARAAAALYAWLFPPQARAAVAGSTTLFIVPSGALYRVPFEALVTNTGRDGAPHYLVEDAAIAYLSSASLLNALRSGVEGRRTTSPDPLLAFANPAFPAGGPFAQLPGSETEALDSFSALGVTPAGIAPPQDAYYTGERATLEAVEALNASNRLQSYRYVLFGTHALLTDTVHAYSQPALVLAHPAASEAFLTMARVFGLTFNAQAILLSACESAGGTLTSGEGVEGLTQAFMYAGTPVVGVTDWQVVDSIQERLTPAFFAAMAAGRAPAEALRQAKLELLRSGDPLKNHPFFWAPMVIFGDGDAAASSGSAAAPSSSAGGSSSDRTTADFP